ncbi:MAG TPA: glycosyltransferase, partial [Gallionella sp.]
MHEQAVALRDAGVDVKIVQPIPYTPFPLPLVNERYRKLSGIPEFEQNEGFDVYHPRYLALPRNILFQHVGKWMFQGIRKQVARIYANWKFDLIHAHTTYPCGYAANLLRDRMLPEVKVVHTIHRTCIIDAPNYNRACYARVKKALIDADTTVFVASEGQTIAHNMTDGVIDARSEYITNGVSISKFTLSLSDKQEVERLKQQYADSWNLVFVGYLNDRKGIRELLPAVAELIRAGRSNLRLFLVGRNDLGNYIPEFIRENQLADNVIEIGSVHHSRIILWMNFAD